MKYQIAVVTFLIVAGLTYSQPPAPKLAFRFQANETHKYDVAQSTTVVEKIADGGTTTNTITVKLKKTWAVKAVDATSGVATMDMTILEFMQTVERKNSSAGAAPTVETIDSANPDDAAKLPFLGKVMQTVQMGPQGQVISVVAAKGAGANAESRVKAELPFRVVMPAEAINVGAKWESPFTLKLAPPQGTGEEIAFIRKATFKGIEKGEATISVAASLKEAPETTSEWLPLIPYLWEGEVYFNMEKGLYEAAKLTIKKELVNHQGQGSSYSHESKYFESRVK